MELQLAMDPQVGDFLQESLRGYTLAYVVVERHWDGVKIQKMKRRREIRRMVVDKGRTVRVWHEMEPDPDGYQFWCGMWDDKTFRTREKSHLYRLDPVGGLGFEITNYENLPSARRCREGTA